MKPLLIIIIIMIALLVVLYFLGKKAQAKKEEQDAQLAASAQTFTMLVIDKKKMKLKDAGLPQAVIDQTPKYMRWSKLPVVKAKIGPRIMTLIADDSVFDLIPIKKEIKATVSGIYITGVRGLRGALDKPEEKKSFRQKIQAKYNQLNAQLNEEEEQNKSSKKNKKK